ncbi:MAG: hypothetical protein CMJ64_20565 [Planctomycetaceae bacterium]|nr:hypothetical protein [Planctomycetaceae bacterium]
MFGRLFTRVVIVFWAITMAWLLAEKVVPPLLDGDPPDYSSALETPAEDQLPEAWKLRWGQRTIGYATSRTVARPHGQTDRLSYVEFEDLPLEALLSELLGPMSAVIQPMLQDSRGLELNMLVATRMRFDDEKRLAAFDTTIDLGEMNNFLKLRGVLRNDGKLMIVAQMSTGGSTSSEIFRQTVELPPEALVEGSLSPRPELRDLHLGQTWTIPVFRAFPPNSPVQILQAEVESDLYFLWGGEDVEAFVVVYRADAGSGVHATRQPLSREWVRRSDGVILRQEVSFSGLEMAFERLTESEARSRGDRLDEIRDRLWPN